MVQIVLLSMQHFEYLSDHYINIWMHVESHDSHDSSVILTCECVCVCWPQVKFPPQEGFLAFISITIFGVLYKLLFKLLVCRPCTCNSVMTCKCVLLQNCLLLRLTLRSYASSPDQKIQ